MKFCIKYVVYVIATYWLIKLIFYMFGGLYLQPGILNDVPSFLGVVGPPILIDILFGQIKPFIASVKKAIGMSVETSKEVIERMWKIKFFSIIVATWFSFTLISMSWMNLIPPIDDVLAAIREMLHRPLYGIFTPLYYGTWLIIILIPLYIESTADNT